MRLVLPIEPCAAARPRVTSKGVFYPPKYQAWLEAARLLARQAWHDELLGGPVRVAVSFQADRIVVEVGRSDCVRPKGVRGDVDNLCKAVLDCLSGVVFFDDRQVVELTARMETQ